MVVKVVVELGEETEEVVVVGMEEEVMVVAVKGEVMAVAVKEVGVLVVGMEEAKEVVVWEVVV